MLKFIRRNKSAFWIQALFAIIALVFIFLYVSPATQRTAIAARVGGEEINQTDFQRAHNNLNRLYQDIYKDNLTPELLENLNLPSKALDQLVSVSLLRQEAGRLGLQVSDSEVANAIASSPNLQVDGRFDKDRYLRALRAQRITPTEFEESQREELLVRKVQRLIRAGVQVSDAEVRDRFRYDREQVELRYIKFDPKDFEEEVSVSDAQLKELYDSDPEQFRAPDRVEIEYLNFDPENIEEEVEIPEDRIARYYESHSEDYAEAEQVRASHILLRLSPDTEDGIKAEIRSKAEDILKQINDGADFSELAAEHSNDTANASKGGDLGFFSRGRMVPDFETAAFALEAGEVSDVIETPFGFHIIKAVEKKAAGTKALADVRELIVSQLTASEAKEAAKARADRAKKNLEDGKTIVDIATNRGIEVQSPSAFSRTEPIGTLGRNIALTNAAFSTEVGSHGEVIESDAGFVVFRVLNKIASHVPSLDDVRDEVSTIAKQKEGAKLASSRAQEALDKLKASNIDSVATEYELEVGETGPIGRVGSYVTKIGSSEDLKRAAFAAQNEGDTLAEVYEVNESSFVATLKGRLGADEEQFEQQKDNLKKQMEQLRAGQAVQAFIDDLKGKASVEIDPIFAQSIGL